MEGNITKTASFDHVTLQMVEEALPQFRGTIMQIPPIFSALRVDGKRLYQHARNGVTADDIEIKARQVEIYGCDLIDPDESKLPKFSIDVECGGG
jgi:tRNA pseudouridine55 synthase